jgi:hypothetical protein
MQKSLSPFDFLETRHMGLKVRLKCEVYRETDDPRLVIFGVQLPMSYAESVLDAEGVQL